MATTQPTKKAEKRVSGNRYSIELSMRNDTPASRGTDSLMLFYSYEAVVGYRYENTAEGPPIFLFAEGDTRSNTTKQHINAFRSDWGCTNLIEVAPIRDEMFAVMLENTLRARCRMTAPPVALVYKIPGR